MNPVRSREPATAVIMITVEYFIINAAVKMRSIGGCASYF